MSEDDHDDSDDIGTNNEPLDVNSLAAKFGGAGSLRMGKAQGSKPYSYEDVLKIRFPEQKKYVGAQNYIPFKSMGSEAPVNASDGNRSNILLPPYADRQTGATSVRQNVNRIDRSGKKPAFMTANQPSSSSSRNQYAEEIRALKLGNRAGQPKSSAATAGSKKHRASDEDDEYDETSDGIRIPRVHPFYQQPTIRTRADVDELLEAIRRDPNYEAQIGDGRSAVLPSNEKVFFNMVPRIYDYKHDKYRPINKEELQYIEDSLASQSSNTPLH